MSLENELLRQDQRTANAFTGSSYEDALAYLESRNYTAHTSYQSYRSNYEEERAKGVVTGEDGRYYNADGEKLYFYTPPSELGAGGDSEQKRAEFLTESEIQEFWDADQGMGYFKEANPHIDFATHLAMADEKTAMIETGQIDVNPYDSEEEVLLNHGFTARGPNADAINEILDAERDARKDAAATQMLELGNALNEKYGVSTTFKNGDGDIFVFNGSNYHKAYKVDDHLGPGDYARMAGMAVIGMAGAAILGPMVQAGLGAAGTTTSSAGVVSASGLSKGLTAALSNSVTQLASGNGVDPMSVLSSAVLAGVNPGGMLGEKLGMVPDSALGGAVSGAVNSAVGGALQGDFDLENSLLAGLQAGTLNIVKDFFTDSDQFSVESRMKQIKEGLASQGITDVTDEKLFEYALQMGGTGTSDLAGLIGKDGLFPDIERVDTTWLNSLLGGGEYNVGYTYTGPDGKEYTDLEVLDMEDVDPTAIGLASMAGTDHNGWTFSKSLDMDSPFDAFVERIFGGAMDAAAKAQFVSTYGFDPEEHPEAAKMVFLYGEVDETYTFSDNPRGDSEVVGQLNGIDGTYSTGPAFDVEAFIDVDEDGKEFWNGSVPYAQLITMAQNAHAAGATGSTIRMLLDGATGGKAGVTLPGANVSLVDAILQGVLDGTQTVGTDDGGNAVILPPGDDGSDGVENPLRADQKYQDWLDSQSDAGVDFTSTEDPNKVDDKKALAAYEKYQAWLASQSDDTDMPTDVEDMSGGGETKELPSDTTEPPPETPATPPPPPPPGSTPPPDPNGPPPELPPELGPIFGSAPVLPGGGGGGGGGGMLKGGDYTPEWGELFAYTTLTPYQKRQLEPMKDVIAEAKGMLT